MQARTVAGLQYRDSMKGLPRCVSLRRPELISHAVGGIYFHPTGPEPGPANHRTRTILIKEGWTEEGGSKEVVGLHCFTDLE